MGFLVDKVALGKLFSEYFGFPCQFSFHRLLHTHHHHLSSGTGTIGQTVADVPNGLSLTPTQETKKKSKSADLADNIASSFISKGQTTDIASAERNSSVSVQY
jgi:hypothetical protein